MNRKKLLIPACLVALFPLVAMAIHDSSVLRPSERIPVVRGGYVLANGGYTLDCKGGGVGCEYHVSDKQCPAGYKPSVFTAIASGGGRCAIKHIYLEPQQGQLIAYNKGYKLHFSYAYMDTWLCPGTYAVSINYSIFCNLIV